MRPPLARAAPWLLLALGVAVAAQSDLRLFRTHPYNVDLEIPLAAARRWMSGGEPYLASAFAPGVEGVGLPFLYPPYVLPAFGVLAVLPFVVVSAAWTLACVGAAVFALHGLGLAWRVVPVVLLWPPFLEALIGGNAEVFAFAAFVGLFVAGPSRAPTAGLLAAATCVLKAAQVQGVLNLLARRRRAGLAAIALLAALVALTLPIVGLDLWRSWLEQAARASDPSWSPIGAPLSTLLPRVVAIALTLLSLVLALVVRGPRTAAWLGLLVVVGAPTLHIFQLLYLLPAMLLVRREIALFAAAGVASYLSLAVWNVVLLLGAVLVASARYPWLLEPSRSARDADHTVVLTPSMST